MYTPNCPTALSGSSQCPIANTCNDVIDSASLRNVADCHCQSPTALWSALMSTGYTTGYVIPDEALRRYLVDGAGLTWLVKRSYTPRPPIEGQPSPEWVARWELRSSPVRRRSFTALPPYVPSSSQPLRWRTTLPTERRTYTMSKPGPSNSTNAGRGTLRMNST